MWTALRVCACVVLLAARPAPARAATDGMLAAVVDGKLVTVNADGSGLRTLTASGEISGLAWAPDGNRLAYSSGGNVVLLDVVTGRATAITNGTDPAWSADGLRIGL